MLKFPASESYCFTLIVFVLTRQETIKMTIQNNTYCSRIQVAFLDTIGDLYGNSGNRFKKINTRGVFNENLFIPYLLGVFPLRMLTREIA